jgi:large conductance mechanosensitive channel
VVTAFVSDILTPLIAAIAGKPNFKSLYFTVNHSQFLYGDVIDALLSFVLVAAAIYAFVILPMNSIAARRAAGADPTDKTCPECQSTIPIAATRCAYCTVELPATS